MLPDTVNTVKCSWRRAKTWPENVEPTWNNKLIYIVHLVGYFHSCITMHGFMNVNNSISLCPLHVVSRFNPSTIMATAYSLLLLEPQNWIFHHHWVMHSLRSCWECFPVLEYSQLEGCHTLHHPAANKKHESANLYGKKQEDLRRKCNTHFP